MKPKIAPKKMKGIGETNQRRSLTKVRRMMPWAAVTPATIAITLGMAILTVSAHVCPRSPGFFKQLCNRNPATFEKVVSLSAHACGAGLSLTTTGCGTGMEATGWCADIGDLCTIINAEPEGNQLVSLARQLIVAKLNDATGLPIDDASVRQAISDAQCLLDSLGVSSLATLNSVGGGLTDSQKDEAERLKDILDAYNNSAPDGCVERFPEGPKTVL